MSEVCRACHQLFPDYLALAQHIATAKQGHRQGKKWAAKYLMRVNQLNRRKLPEGRASLTEAQKETRRSLFLELSGQMEIVTTWCPQCKSRTRQALPVEYAESNTAWRTPQQLLVVSCPTCATK